MKTNTLTKCLSPFLGLGLVLGLLLFLSNSSAVAQDAQATPLPNRSDDSEDYPDADPAFLAQEPTKREVLLADVMTNWTSPYTDPVKSTAWGDYDRDGDLDLLVGNGTGTHNRLYQNNDGVLTSIWTGSCTNANDNTSSVSWLDFNRDGYLDMAFGVKDGRNCIYENLGSSFSRIWYPTTPQATTSIGGAGWQIGDTFLSYLAVGNTGGNKSAIYSFNELGTASLKYTFETSYSTRDLNWGDFNNDSLPDLAFGNFNQQTIIFRNTGVDHSQLRFTAHFTIPLTLYTNSISWGDMDNDGDLDLALGNGYESGPAQRDYVFCNDGYPDYTFYECWQSNDSSRTNTVEWGDYDGDGDLDLIAGGDYLARSRIYVNNGNVLNGAATEFNDTNYVVNTASWGDLNSDGDLELLLGYDGNASPGLSKPIEIIDQTANSWKLQNFESISDLRRGSSLAWGDIDGDGYLDLVVGNSEGQQNQLYFNDGSGLSLSAWNPPLGNARSLALGDMDNDGDLDLAVGNNGQRNRVYENINGVLQDNYYDDFVDVNTNATYAVAWGDYDGDGDLDLAEGNFNTSQANRIFINRYGIFTETVSLGNASDRTSSLAWGDFDQDYDLDLLVGNDGQADRVYINDGLGGFTSITLPAPLPTSNCTSNKTLGVTWADWDADGDLDAGLGLEGCVRVLTASKSGSTWSFAEAWSMNEMGLLVLGISWGDYNGDGLPDLLLATDDLQFGGLNRIYRNTGTGMELYWVAPLEDLDTSRAAAWADFDNDGDLDFAVINTEATNQPDRLYINTWVSRPAQEWAGIANDPSYLDFIFPQELDTNNAQAFFVETAYGDPAITIAYNLYDNESDSAFMIEHQVSWDGGYYWEPAWEMNGSQDGVWTINNEDDTSASPSGVPHYFMWDALNQLLAHQNIPFNPDSNIYVPFLQSWEEMDVAFRVVARNYAERGGPIQRPLHGVYSNMLRIDMRPDWSDSAKTFDGETPEAVHPGDLINLTVEITQTDHGMPPGAYIIDHLPSQLYMEDYGLAWADGAPSDYYYEITSTITTITWTGAIEYDYYPQYPHIYRIHFSPRVVRPLPNGLDVTNCADIYDGLHAPFERCLTFEISSTPKTDESWKLVNGVTYNEVLPGELLTYTIVLTNTGTDNAHSAIMTDVVPANTVWLNSLVASSGTIVYEDGVINWMGDLNVFEPVFLTYTVQVEKPLPGSTLITNTFSLQDNINPVWIAPEVTTFVLAPDLRSSTKTDLPDPVELDDPVFYTIILHNTGGLTAMPAYLTDPIPAGSRYITNTLVVEPPTATYGYDADQDRIFWIGNLAPDESVTLTYGIYAGLTAESPNGIITNTAYITDTWGGPVTIVATTTVSIPDLSGSFKVASTEEVVVGDLITYTVTISNTGGYGPNITATDPIPEGSEAVLNSFSTTNGSGGIFGNTVNWDGTLDTLESSTFSFAVTAGCPNVYPGAVISNVVYIESPSGLILERTALTYVNLPDLNGTTITVNKSSASAGDIVRYTITIPNTGVYGELSMVNNLPPELEWVSGHATTGSLTYNSGQRRVRWEGPLDTGQQVIITIDVRVRPNLIVEQINNSFLISDGCQEFLHLAPTVQVGNFVYLPLINKR